MSEEAKPRTYMSGGKWHLCMDAMREALFDDIQKNLDEIVKLQLTNRELQRRFDEVTGLEQSAQRAEEQGFGVRYFEEDERFCYETFEKQAGFHGGKPGPSG